jgi:hypothetical protein
VIDMTNIDQRDPATWCDLHGAHVAGDTVTLYKALGGDLTSGGGYNPIAWPTSGEIVCDDFDPADRCGGGLHLGPTPSHATAYRADATRWLKVTAQLGDLAPVIDGTAKVKVARCVVVGEVDRWGADIR